MPTYSELQKELIEEAKLLLDIALKMRDKPPDKEVPQTEIDAYQDDYHATHEVEPSSPRAGTGRAKISC